MILMRPVLFYSKYYIKIFLRSQFLSRLTINNVYVGPSAYAIKNLSNILLNNLTRFFPTRFFPVLRYGIK